MRGSITETAAERFARRVNETTQNIQKRMLAYKQVLLGGVGLFTASDTVSRKDWKAYFEQIKLEENYPGILGIGLSVVLSPEELDKHIQRVRAAGFPDYIVWPKSGNYEMITSIIYLEPFSGRNLRAFGYDMFTNETRRKAMRAARDNGKAAVSGRVTLVQETDEDIQAGFLMYLPLYKKNYPTGTVEERRRALQSFVYSPFRMNDLMEGIIGFGLPDIHLAIYDDETIQKSSMMYNSDPLYKVDWLHENAAFSVTRPVEIEGHTWYLRYASLPSFENSIDYERPRVVLITGILISFLFFFFIRSISQNWLLDRKLERILESIGEGVYGIDLKGCCTFINDSAVRMLDFKPAEILNKSIHDLIHVKENGSEYPSDECPILLSTRDGKERIVENELFRRKDGSLFPVEYFSNPILHNGEIKGAVVTFNDITARLKSEEEVKELATRLKDTVESITDAFFTLDHNWRFTFVNDKTEELLLKNRNELLNAEIWEKFPEMVGTIFYKKFNDSALRNNAASFEEYYEPLEKWLEVHIYPSNYGLTVFLRDVTGRVEAAEQLEASLKEKDVLLKEIHHRVKNNLQIIASLLNLQYQHANDINSAEILVNSQNRIKSMALIHEKLYQADNVSRINFSVYANDLIRHLFTSYLSGKEDIRFNINIEDVNVQLDKTISLGLIINELVSNSLKHAFKSAARLKEGFFINLSMRQKNEEEIILIISDNGNGFPENVDFKKTSSLGLQLVNALVDQIDGTIELEKNDGCKFVIVFPV